MKNFVFGAAIYMLASATAGWIDPNQIGWKGFLVGMVWVTATTLVDKVDWK